MTQGRDVMAVDRWCVGAIQYMMQSFVRQCVSIVEQVISVWFLEKIKRCFCFYCSVVLRHTSTAYREKA